MPIRRPLNRFLSFHFYSANVTGTTPAGQSSDKPAAKSYSGAARAGEIAAAAREAEHAKREEQERERKEKDRMARKEKERKEKERKEEKDRKEKERRRNEESEKKGNVRREIMKIEESGTNERAINIMTEATRRATITEGAGTIVTEIAIVTVLHAICLAIVPLNAIMSIATAGRKAKVGPGFHIGSVSLTNLI